MKLPRILTALLCAGLLCMPAAADSLTDAPDPPEITPAVPAIQIQNTHIYEHMQQSYAQGYEPLIDGGFVVIVLPLYCESEEKPESLRVSVVPEPSNSPFVIRNYEQTVPLAIHMASDGTEQEIYLAEFWLELSAERVNGCYPVQFSIADAGVWTVYVNITDGIDSNAEEPVPLPETTPPEEPVILQPKILVQSISGEEIAAGETAELHITLKNTSHTEELQNLTVTASAPPYLTLEAAADTLYFEEIGADAEFDAVFRIRTAADTPAGSFDLPLQFDFAYGKGMTGAGSGTARITITQPVQMKFQQVAIPAEAIVSDRLELHIQALNLGKTTAANVRAELTADGLLPEGTAFIGDVAGGTAAEAVLYVQVSSKRGAEPYGDTTGQITFTYTDENGIDHTETQDFSLMLKSPFSERTSEPEQADSRAWVWIMAGIGGSVLLLSGILLQRRKRGTA